MYVEILSVDVSTGFFTHVNKLFNLWMTDVHVSRISRGEQEGSLASFERAFEGSVGVNSLQSLVAKRLSAWQSALKIN